MRLLQRGPEGGLVFTQDLLPNDIPPYGILSHTWGKPEDEVTFQDILQDAGRQKPGYKKILFVQEQAARDGLQYFWADTCCIDKSNHTEYAEAINSMFRWYQNATACYVYLADVQQNEADKMSFTTDFHASRWFTRGWTLQELLAPSVVLFFSADGQRLGDKKSLCQEIHKGTNIPIEALEKTSFSTFTVEERMSWSDSRQTTKSEDKAYSLMGIFGVHMVPIYGEGEQEAFERLKHQIAHRNNHKREDKQLEQAFDQCIADLRVTDPRNDKSRIESTKGGLLKASYSWILQHEAFQLWCQNDQPLLWIKGEPGMGKTMLLCGLIDDLSTIHLPPRGRLLSYFFCQATDANLNNALAVIRGLIYNICRQDRSLIKYVYDEWKLAGKDLFEDSNAIDALTMILNNILEHDTSTERVFIVDALDECSKDLPKLLHFINQQSATGRAKWIISSRNWPQIEERLQTTNRKIKLSLELNTTSIAEAVRIYIRHKVGELQEMKRFDDSRRSQIIEYLDDNANHTFLWVAMVCQRLQNSKSWRILKDLKELPTGLNEFYQKMLRYVAESEDADILFEILSVVSVAYRPIGLSEMAAVLNIPSEITDDEEALRELIGYCGSFLTVRDNFVYLIHQSAQEFLLSQTNTSLFPEGIQKKHTQIALKSIKVLSNVLKRDMYHLRHPGILISDVQVPADSKLVPIQYVCTSWVDHLIDGRMLFLKGNVADLEEVERFFKKYFIYWLEALSLLGNVSNISHSISKLLGSIRQEQTKKSLGNLIYDARRFISYHAAMIAKYPLQLYISGLLFSPTESIIRKLFRYEEPNWVTLSPPIKKHWGAMQQLLEGHAFTVNSVAFSADGKSISSGSDDDTVRIWSAESGECQQRFDRHGNAVQDVKFLDDGTVVAASGDKVIWFQSSGEELVYHHTREHRGPGIVGLSLSFDGKLVALGLDNGDIEILTVDNSRGRKTLHGHIGWVAALAFSPDGETLASGADDETVRFWSIEGDNCYQTLEGHDGPVSSIIFSADGKLIGVGSKSGTIRIWSVEQHVWLKILTGHIDDIRSIAFSPNSDLLVSGSLDKTVRLWSVATGELQRILETHHFGVNSVAFSPQGHLVASSGAALIRISSLEANSYHSPLYDSLAPTEGQLAASGQERANCNEPPLEEVSSIIKADKNSVTCIAFSKNLMASASRDRNLRIWSTDDHMLQGHVMSPDDWIHYISFSPDGKFIGAITVNRTVCVWSIDFSSSNICHPSKTFCAHEEYVNSLAFSPDNKKLATGSDDNTIRIWSMDYDSCRFHSLEAHSGGITSVALSTNIVVSGSMDETVRIWSFDGSVYNYRRRLTGHNGYIISVAVSPDSTLVASSCWNGQTRICSVDDGTCLYRLSAIPTTSLSFDMNGRLVTNSGIIYYKKPMVETKVVSASRDLIETVNIEPVERHIYHIGLGAGREWLCLDESPILWMPNEYRAFNNAFAISGSTMVWNSGSGQLLMLKFSLPSQ